MKRAPRKPKQTGRPAKTSLILALEPRLIYDGAAVARGSRAVKEILPCGLAEAATQVTVTPGQPWRAPQPSFGGSPWH